MGGGEVGDGGGRLAGATAVQPRQSWAGVSSCSAGADCICHGSWIEVCLWGRAGGGRGGARPRHRRGECAALQRTGHWGARPPRGAPLRPHMSGLPPPLSPLPPRSAWDHPTVAAPDRSSPTVRQWPPSATRPPVAIATATYGAGGGWVGEVSCRDTVPSSSPLSMCTRAGRVMPRAAPPGRLHPRWGRPAGAVDRARGAAAVGGALSSAGRLTGAPAMWHTSGELSGVGCGTLRLGVGGGGFASGGARGRRRRGPATERSVECPPPARPVAANWQDEGTPSGVCAACVSAAPHRLAVKTKLFHAPWNEGREEGGKEEAAGRAGEWRGGLDEEGGGVKGRSAEGRGVIGR